MTYQTGKNAQVVFKVETTFGTKPTTGGASVFRASPTAGLELKKANVNPTEYRSDGQTVQARHGSKSVDGNYTADLSVSTFDALFEAVLRGTWLPTFAITQAQMTSITTVAGPPGQIVAAAGSWITQGVKVGDIIVATGYQDASVNSRNLRVVGVTASTITTAEALTTNAAPDTTFSIQVLKRLVQGIPPVGRSFTIEEYLQDIDSSQVFKGCRLAKVALKFAADQTVSVTFDFVGQDMETLTGASAPYFVAPTISVNVPLVISDGVVRVNGLDAIDFTSFDVTFDLKAAGQPVIGSLITPDVFTNPAMVTASLTGLRSDLTRLGLFVSETVFDIQILCVEPMAEPKNCMSFYFGNCKMMGNQKNLGADGALMETIPVNIGQDSAGGAHSLTMIQVNSSAP